LIFIGVSFIVCKCNSFLRLVSLRYAIYTIVTTRSSRLFKLEYDCACILFSFIVLVKWRHVITLSVWILIINNQAINPIYMYYQNLSKW
jgi:hypothetical protein